MSGFVDRENEIFDTLEAFNDHGLSFIVVGGYAVSAYHHRFSVDADLVIQEPDLDQFIEILEHRGFEEVHDRQLDAYRGRYLAYEKDKNLPVTIDLLVNSLQCRQTDATWSYKYFQHHSTRTSIDGTEQSVTVRIPEKELLAAVKLHSGRLTDARDVVALAGNLDDEKIDTHIDRGDTEKLRSVLEKIEETISSEDFADAFKGVFQQGQLPEDNIRAIQSFIRRQFPE